MDYVIGVQIVESLRNIADDLPNDFFLDLFLLKSSPEYQIEQITLFSKFHKNIHIFFVVVIETRVELNDIGMMNGGEDFSLVENHFPFVLAKSK
jgi:hypothetical protein